MWLTIDSAVGKTQFVLSLLLSAQLIPPHGLGRPVIYLSTESSLNTTRLVQMLEAHPHYQSLPANEKPSLDRILTIDAHDISTQDRIVQYQLLQTVQTYRVGLVVVDSVAANFRAEFQGSSKKVMLERAVSLAKLGKALRKIAVEENVAIVVTNQVSDRFDDAKAISDKFRLSSQVPLSSLPPTQADTKQQTDTTHATSHQNPPVTYPSSVPRRDEIMSLDFQQRFFTGWGDNPNKPFETMKTPALGLTWANQIDGRVVLTMSNTSTHAASEAGHIWTDTKRIRSLRVVFASWTGNSHRIRYSLEMQGPTFTPPNLARNITVNDVNGENAELLDPRFWDLEDTEFP